MFSTGRLLEESTSEFSHTVLSMFAGDSGRWSQPQVSFDNRDL